MNTTFPSRIELARLVVQRPQSKFASDLSGHSDSVAERVEGRRVLVVGGAGSIGSATVRELLRFEPRELHVVDLDENGLAELARSSRSEGRVRPGTRLRLTPMDLSGHLMGRMLGSTEPYDLVLNFAALKHVRSEKDVFSQLRMLDINVVAARQLLDWLTDLGTSHYFAVSTDKAANPVNLMGATKRAMELAMLDARMTQSVTSARFANVAFSNGSLLDGWLRRLEGRQPWAVPTGTRRYFVTAEESGQLCLLASTVASDRSIVIPKLDPELHLRDLVEVAEEVLDFLGLRPLWCTTEDEARLRMVETTHATSWPVLLTPLDTMGEKNFEEFVGAGDILGADHFEDLRTLHTLQPSPDRLDAFLEKATWLLSTDGPVSSDDLITCLHLVVPELMHTSSAKSLDARM